MPAYKNKERSTWYSAFYYTDWTGKKKKKKKEGFKTQREAKTFEREFLERSQASPEMTFKTLVSLYLEDCKSRLKPTTYSNKEYVISTKLLPYFGSLSISKIEPATVRQWQNEFINHENQYSPTYLKTINNQLSAIFNFAMKYYKLPSNPARICGSMGKKNAETMTFWTKEEFSKFISTISDKSTSKVMFELLFWTGIRTGELLALTLNDFDLQAQTLSITKNYARHKGEHLILEPKTAKSKRVVTIPKFLCDLISNYTSKLYGYISEERIFQTSRYYLRHEMIRGSKIANLNRIRVHDLRHSHASLLIELGFSPLLISERLGHESIETTLNTYSHLYPNKHGEVASKLQELISSQH